LTRKEFPKLPRNVPGFFHAVFWCGVFALQ
jgi:hypothetical protein